MMSRGGRENGAQRRNPRITLIALSGIWEGDFDWVVKHLLKPKWDYLTFLATNNMLFRTFNRDKIVTLCIMHN